MTKIAFIGAGSTVFAKNLLGDILSFPELSGAQIALMDIDPERLRTSEIVALKVAAATGAHPQVTATADRRAALDGADYVISMFQVAGYKPGTVIDFDVPKRYGLRQTIADTLGIGGIMRGLRTIPVMLDLCRDMEALCPDAWFLQYVNPMAMNCWAIARASRIKTVGLCHSVQGTAMQLAQDIGVPYDELDYLCAGINHMAFYLRFARRDGEDLTPCIRQVIADGRVPDWNRVRYELFQRFGHFVTESSEHVAEYVPWFIKRDRPELIEQFNIPLDEYIQRCEVQIAAWHAMREYLEGDGDVVVERSHEYGSLIVHSMETGAPRTVYGNVMNRQSGPDGDRLLIDNLPRDCCVEVPCHVGAAGLVPQSVGALPPQLAALMQTNINVQALTVEAALTGKREHVYHAAMLDPHTAAELSLDQIAALVDDLLAAHGDWIPQLV
ncbi:MAG: alpha-glucosidase/alpha-galactosidase [Chloroflexi bacterium]|nr:alpha-glucosidase/alpha-galactosidase [Chloroflexota bacterium]